MTFKAISEEQWQAIRSFREDWSDDTDWLNFRHDLELEGGIYWSLHEVREELGVPSKMRNRLEALLRQCRKLQDGLNSLPEPIMLGMPDITPLDAWLQDLVEVYTKAAEVDRHFFSGKSDHYRDVFQHWLLREWVNTFRGELSFSRDLNETPYGPLIDFLSITLKTVLGKAPGPSGLAKIIEEYR